MSHYKEADYYDLLEVRPDAAPAEIQEAYKRQMELLSGESLATYGLFVADDVVHFRQRVEEAHRVLSDPTRRRAYDVASGFADAPAEAEPAEAVAGGAPEALVAHEAGAAPLAEAAPVAMSGGPAEGDAPEAAEPVEAAAPAEAAAQEPFRVPEPGALPPFGPPPTEAAAGPAPAEAAPEGAAQPAGDGERFDGPAMRAVRERKQITLSSISQNTRIAEYYLEYIEAERFDSLPPPIYLRSYIRQYAAAIGVDEDRAVDEFLARYNDGRNEKS